MATPFEQERTVRIYDGLMTKAGQIAFIEPKTVLKLLLVGLGLIYLFWTAFGSSVYGGGGRGHDFAVFYNAGRLLLDGTNPYARQTTEAVPVKFRDRLGRYGVYAYPPQFSSITLSLGSLAFNAALSLFDALNLVFTALLAWGVTLLVWPGRRLVAGTLEKGFQDADYRACWWRQWWIIATILLFAPFTSYTLWLGQTTIIIFALLVWAWWFELRGHWLPAGLLLGVATCNPPLVLLPIVWLLCDRRFKPLLVGLVTALVLSIPVFWVVGPLNAFYSWYEALSLYSVTGGNTPGSRDAFGIRSFVFAASRVTLPDLTVLGVACAVVIWFCRSRLTDAETLALLVLAGLLTTNAHPQTLVGLILTVPALIRHFEHRRWVLFATLVLGALVLLPRRLLEKLGSMPHVVLQWRVLVVLALGSMIIALIALRERHERISRAK
jgi:Glycosyltransferase family 87